MKALRTLVVDDEPLAVRRLTLLLSAIEGISLIGTETRAAAAVDMIKCLKPDLLVLDIAMPGLNGFQVIEALDPADAPAIVFVTAHNEHALRAFNLHAVDYLMKPVGLPRLRVAIDRARCLVGKSTPAQQAPTQDAAALLSQPNAQKLSDSFWVTRFRQLVRVSVDTIIWIEAEGDYVRFHTAAGGGTVRATMASIERQLDPIDFARVHRSVIVRRSEILSLQRKVTGALVATLASGQEVPVGRRYGIGLRSLSQAISKLS